MIRHKPRSVSVLLAVAAIVAVPAGLARAQGMYGWGGPDVDGPGGWSRGGDRWGDARGGPRTSAEPSKKISVDAWRAADAGDALGKGRIVIAAGDDGAEAEWKLPVYEAAVVDELARRGYDTATAVDPGQVAQVSVSHETVVPEEAPHKPVSGEVSTTVSNRGTGFGMAIALDFTKPKKAIVATRLAVRIRDKASGKVLWEGRAEGQAREGDVGLDNGAVAARLAAALFAKFPEGQVVPLANP